MLSSKLGYSTLFGERLLGVLGVVPHTTPNMHLEHKSYPHWYSLVALNDVSLVILWSIWTSFWEFFLEIVAHDFIVWLFVHCWLLRVVAGYSTLNCSLTTISSSMSVWFSYLHSWTIVLISLSWLSGFGYCHQVLPCVYELTLPFVSSLQFKTRPLSHLDRLT